MSTFAPDNLEDVLAAAANAGDEVEIELPTPKSSYEYEVLAAATMEAHMGYIPRILQAQVYATLAVAAAYRER